MHNVYHTEFNKTDILANPIKNIVMVKGLRMPQFRNKLWLSKDTLYTLKRMDTKYLLAAVHIMENNGGKQFEKTNDAIAQLKDLKDELTYRKNLIDCVFKKAHMFDTFKKNQYEPCKFLGEVKPSTFSTRGLKVI